MKQILAIVLNLILVANCLKLTDLPRKSLAGPPSEFAANALPEPISGALAEDSAYYEVIMTPKDTDSDDKQKLQWSSQILVDSDSEFTLSVFSSLDLKVKLRDPSGNKVSLHGNEVKSVFPIGSHEFPQVNYRFEQPTKGVWTVKLSTQKKFSSDEISAMSGPQASILVWNKSPVRSFTHLSSYNLKVGQQVGLVTELTANTTLLEGIRPDALAEYISDATMDIVLPDGVEEQVNMVDDGLHFDLEANDGIYGAQIAATETGMYRATAVVKGTHPDGTAFVRTSQHIISVVDDSLTLSRATSTQMKDKDIVTIYIQVTSSAVDTDKLYRAYAEVYGKDSNGNDVAICWIARMTNVETVNGSPVISIEMHADWISYANAQGPLTLKNVIVQETVGFVPIAEASEIPVTENSDVTRYLYARPAVTEITKEMRQGKLTRPVGTVSGNPKLVLLHGYCSSSNPWEPDSHIFTDSAFFLNPDANINNEEFASKVADFVDSQGITSFGLIGHSQGGMVAAHLLNYFETGMDYAAGNRRVQTLGTPWKGSSAAGTAASLGKVFGIGCGTVADLTTDGARLWLAGITAETQKEIYSYTTTYEQGNFFGDWCSLPMNSILEWPNDGVTELDHAILPNGNYMGNTQKQCHTTGMAYISQYDDEARNAVLNQNAAR